MHPMNSALLLLAALINAESLEGQRARRSRSGVSVRRSRVGQQLLEATVSGFDPSSFPPCYTDKDCSNGLNQQGRCVMDGVSISGQANEEMDSSLEGLRRQKVTLDQFSQSASAEAFERYLRRYLWTIFKSTVTKEPVGHCVVGPSEGRLKTLSQIPRAVPEKASDAWEIMEEPLEFDIPTILRKAAPADRFQVALDDLQRTVNIGSLGEIECSAVTKLGHFDGVRTPTHGTVSKGIPIHGAFLIKFSPLMTLGEELAAGLVRYVAEPYEFITSRQKISQVLGFEGVTPEYKVLQRREMKTLLTTLAELSAMGNLHPRKSDPVGELLNYVDGPAFSMVRPTFRKLVEHKIYTSFREVTHGIELTNGVLTLMCENPGEGIANVEITYFLPAPELLAVIHALMDEMAGGGPATSHAEITIADLLAGLEYSTLDQNVCATRILCLDTTH